MNSNNSQIERQCLACGETLLGKYCHACGEKALDRSEYSLERFFEETVHTFTHVDNKFLQSIVLLLLKPGVLTKEYVSGKRKHFVKPIALFFVLNVVYFFIQPLANLNTFNTTLKAQTRYFPYSPMAAKFVDQKLQNTKLGFAEYEKIYNAKSEQLAKTLIVVQIPFFAFFVSLVHFFSKRFYFFEHLIFSTHFYAFELLFNVLATFGVFVYFKLGGNGFDLEKLFLSITLLYLCASLRKVYAQKWFLYILQGALLLASFVGVIFIYRLILFFVTFYFT